MSPILRLHVFAVRQTRLGRRCKMLQGRPISFISFIPFLYLSIFLCYVRVLHILHSASAGFLDLVWGQLALQQCRALPHLFRIVFASDLRLAPWMCPLPCAICSILIDSPKVQLRDRRCLFSWKQIAREWNRWNKMAWSKFFALGCWNSSYYLSMLMASNAVARCYQILYTDSWNCHSEAINGSHDIEVSEVQELVIASHARCPH